MVIPEIFNQAASSFKDKIALQIKKETWHKFTYGQIQNLSLKVGSFLIKEGFKKGDFAAIILENRPEWLIIYLGIMYAGLTAVPLDLQSSPKEISNLIIDSQAKIIFSSFDIFINKIKQNIKDPLIKFVVLDIKESKEAISFSDIELMSYEHVSWPSIKAEDIASLIYTSGTTAYPKGVLLSQENICSNFRSIQKLNLCFPSDNFLSILPLHHTYAFMVTFIVPLFLGARVTYCVSFKPQDLSQIIKEAEITILVGVPQLFSLLHKAYLERIKKIPFIFRFAILPFIKRKLHKQFRSLRLLVSGGARLSPNIARDLSGLGFKLIEGYGLTETSPIVTLNPPENLKFGSVGKPVPYVYIKIDEPDKSGVGEVLIKGPNVMQGYFKQPELTKKAIKEGWFYSGDLGYLDKEGYLYLVGREKEVIVLGSGKNIYPEELEEYYGQSPYIKEMCILSRPEERFGQPTESLYAIVVPHLEYFKKMNETDIRGKIRWELENLAKGLAPYKHIMGFTIIKEELARTPLKKLKRYLIRQKYMEEKLKVDIKEVALSEEESKILRQPLSQKIIKYISSQLNKPVYLDSHLEIDLGIDSLERVELGLGLEALLNIKIPDELLYRVSTVKEIIINISELVNKTTIPDKTKETERNWYSILRQQPSKTILRKIRLKPNIFDILLTGIFKNMLLFIFRTFWLLKIKGREYLPKEGPYLICPNHASYLDGFVVFSSLPFRNSLNIFFIGFRQIFEHPMISWATKISRLIPIDPEANFVEAMQAVSFVLSHRKFVCIFPEGRRSINENIQEFKKGVGILLKELDIPVIPAYIKGSHHSWPRGSCLPRFYPLKIIFGKAVSLKELIIPGEPITYETIAKTLREEVLKLAC